MKKQVIVIGLGQFGHSLAKALAARGIDVLAVDRRNDRVRSVADFVAEAVAFDATDNEALARTSPERRDLAVCAIGDESKESSIICTALLRQMGSPRVIARANDEVHARILRLVGAHEVVNPELEFGERLANHLVYRQVLGELPLGDDLVMTQMKPPKGLFGQALSSIQLPRRYGITVVAIRRGKKNILLPEPNETVREDDTIVVVSREGAVARLMEENE